MPPVIDCYSVVTVMLPPYDYGDALLIDATTVLMCLIQPHITCWYLVQIGIDDAIVDTFDIDDDDDRVLIQ